MKILKFKSVTLFEFALGLKKILITSIDEIYGYNLKFDLHHQYFWTKIVKSYSFKYKNVMTSMGEN